jgi:hypothetical protein
MMVVTARGTIVAAHGGHSGKIDEGREKRAERKEWRANTFLKKMIEHLRGSWAPTGP